APRGCMGRRTALVAADPHGEPARPGLGLEQRVRLAGRQVEPVAGRELERLAADLEPRGAGGERDPLVLVLGVLARPGERAAEDLLDDDAARVEERAHLLAALGSLGREPAAQHGGNVLANVPSGPA